MPENMTPTDLAGIPHPEDATKISDWRDDGDGRPSRYFRGSSWVVNRDPAGFPGRAEYDVVVLVDGIQHADGRITREISSDVKPDAPLTAAQARQLAHALNAAADEVQRLTTI